MEAYFGSHFHTDEDQSRRYAECLRARDMIREDGSLKGPAERYSISELWCYLHHLWRESRDDGNQSAVFTKMQDSAGRFDKDKALDVVLAIYSTHAAPAPAATGLEPHQLFGAINLLKALDCLL